MKKAMIVGGNGSLGKAVVNSFKRRNWGVLSLDIIENHDADANIQIS